MSTVLIAVTRYPPDFAGGAERVIAALAQAARRQGHDVRVLATKAYANFPSEPFEGVPVRRVDWPKGLDPAGWEAVRYTPELLQSETRPDVVWCGNAAMGLGICRAWKDVPVAHVPGDILPVGWRPRLR